MGFPLDLVESDAKHYGSFVCGVCGNLASLDVVVTPCNHPFCLPCLEVWIQKRLAEDLNCRCPSCRSDLETSQADAGGTLSVDNRHLQVETLETAQPLAFNVLKTVQVKCQIRNDSPNDGVCYWAGDYGEVRKHQVKHKLVTVQSPKAQQNGAVQNQRDFGESRSDEEVKHQSQR